MVEHTVDITIPFHDVDMMGVCWHGHYVRYLEIARCALLDTIDYGYRQMRESGYAWPVIDMQLRYARPCRFEDVISVRARVVESEFRLGIDYLITNRATGERLTKARTAQVAVAVDTGEMCVPLPPILAEKLGAHDAA